uniref:Prohead serine protease n=1 Tax=Siphoviridae sp. ctgn638 TaxID=2827913 RepID=A0A8S5TKP7_9CAUD|nr:MAG TPA: prohead serine protease [Siphoviridae sp. ctgn638]
MRIIEKMTTQNKINSNYGKRCIELRNATTSEKEEKRVLEGMAVVFNKPTILYEYDGVQYKEVIDRHALDNADFSDCCLKYNHVDSVPVLARCRGNSLITTIQDNGLWFRAKLFNTTVARDVYNIVKEGGLDKCSFAFKIKRSEYDAQTHIRTILEIDKVYDLSIVDIPAYADTEVEARSLVELDNEARKKTLDSENEARKRAYIRTLL